MKHTLSPKAIAAAFGILLCTAPLCSCSDDDAPLPPPGDEVTPVNEMFPYGIPLTQGLTAVKYEENGEVAEFMTSDGRTITFDYIDVATRAADSHVSMTINSLEGIKNYQLTLNEDGYVSYCVETDIMLRAHGAENQEQWWITYNEDGRITKIQRTDDGNETTTIKYNEAGDITDVQMLSDNPDNCYMCEIDYTTSDFPTPIVNKGNVMFFEYCYGVNVGDLCWAYYAGMLGKATTNLPQLIRQKASTGEVFVSGMTWTLNGSNLPTQLRFDDGAIYSISW